MTDTTNRVEQAARRLSDEIDYAVEPNAWRGFDLVDVPGHPGGRLRLCPADGGVAIYAFDRSQVLLGQVRLENFGPSVSMLVAVAHSLASELLFGVGGPLPKHFSIPPNRHERLVT